MGCTAFITFVLNYFVRASYRKICITKDLCEILCYNFWVANEANHGNKVKHLFVKKRKCNFIITFCNPEFVLLVKS